MAKYTAARVASGNPVLTVYLEDEDGLPLTGLTHSSSGLVVAWRRELSASATVHAQASSNLETISTLGTYAAPTTSKARFKEVDATNLPGFYEIHLPQAAHGTADASRLIHGVVRGVTGLRDCPFEAELVPDAIPNDSTQLARVSDVATVAGYVDTEIASIISTLSTIAGYLDTEIAAIKAKTDNLPSDTATTLSTIAAYIDTEVAAIKAKTDQMNFGVTNRLDVNTTHMNETLIAGTGTSGDKWRG